MKFPKIPMPFKFFLQGSAFFFIISIVASLSFTSNAVLLTLTGAIIAGFYSAFRMKRKEFLISSVVTLIPNILLQILYFWNKAHLVSPVTILILAILNVCFISLLALAGGTIAFFIRKYQERKDNELKQRIAKTKDTRWLDRLFAITVLAFYIGMFTLPAISVHASSDCSANKQNTDTFIECYDPANQYKVSSQWVYEKPKNRMPKEGVNLENYYEQYPDLDQNVINELYTACSQKNDCNFDSALQTYYDGVQTIKDSAPSLIEGPLLIAKGMTYGIFHWNEKNSMKKAYMNGVWVQTKGYANAIGSFLKHPVRTTGKFISDNLNLYSSIQTLKFNLAKDSLRYIGNSYKKIFQGNIKQGFSDLFNLPKWATFLVDNNYPGGSKKLVKQVSSKETWSNIGEGAAKMFLTDQTISLFKQGDWQHGIAQGAGEATIHLLAGVAIAKTISLVPKAAGFVRELALLRQVEKEPKLLNPPIIITQKGIQHVADRHINPASFASQFNKDINLGKVIKEGTQHPMVKQPNGNFVRIYDTGKNVGIDRYTGKQSSFVTIVTNKKNELVTMHAGKP